MLLLRLKGTIFDKLVRLNLTHNCKDSCKYWWQLVDISMTINHKNNHRYLLRVYWFPGGRHHKQMSIFGEKLVEILFFWLPSRQRFKSFPYFNSFPTPCCHEASWFFKSRCRFLVQIVWNLVQLQRLWVFHWRSPDSVVGTRVNFRQLKLLADVLWLKQFKVVWGLSLLWIWTL